MFQLFASTKTKKIGRFREVRVTMDTIFLVIFNIRHKECLYITYSIIVFINLPSFKFLRALQFYKTFLDTYRTPLVYSNVFFDPPKYSYQQVQYSLKREFKEGMSHIYVKLYRYMTQASSADQRNPREHSGLYLRCLTMSLLRVKIHAHSFP